MTTKKEPFKSKGKERYVMLRYWLLKSQAWNSLSGNARALYVELAQRYNGSNNGRIPYSVREAKQSLHISSDTASRLLDILQARGFIVCTRKGYFSVKTTKDASEWLLTEQACDHPPAHATRDFMRWQPPEGVDIDTLNRRPSHHRKSKTRYPQSDRTVPPVGPYGTPSRTVNGKKRQNGTPSRTVKAQNGPSTVPPAEHLQLPGRGCEPGALLPFPEGAPAEKKPWSTPTVEEVSVESLPTELRMLVLGLPDAVADVPHQVEAQPQPDPDPVLVMQDSKEDAGLPPVLPPAMTYDEEVAEIMRRQMPPGDQKRALNKAKNREMTRQFDAGVRAKAGYH
jgi:hypothetical protein